MNPNTRNRLTLIVLIVLFSAPVVLAVLMQSPWLRYEPRATRNHGQFVEPPLQIAGKLFDPAGSLVRFEPQANLWTLLYRLPEPCESACLERLDLLHRVRLAMGRHIDRARVLVLIEPGTAWPPAGLRSPAQHLHPVLAGGPLALDWTLGDTEINLHLVDPEGHVILRYPEPALPTGIQRDFQRLLNWSKYGR